MAEWRKFNPSNKPGRCRWCGQKLRKEQFGEGSGGYGDGKFCGLRCGYMFGVEMAKTRQFVEIITQHPQHRR